MMTYTYKCFDCAKTKEIEIETWDITGNRGHVDMEALNDRIYMDRTCECGGRLRKYVDATADPILFSYVTLGKNSRRYK